MIRAASLAEIAERSKRLAGLLEMIDSVGVHSHFAADALPIAAEYAHETRNRVAQLLGPRAA